VSAVAVKDELDRDQIGNKLTEVLGKLAQSGGPEVMAKIQEFIQSIMSQETAEVGGGNGGEIQGGMPVETPMPFPT
jgi:hypothetical protein